jgi:hypothetical protein
VIVIAIVRVTVGLLPGGVLKGRALITRDKIQNNMIAINGPQAACRGCHDRYRPLSGDDPLAASRWSSATAPARPLNSRNRRVDNRSTSADAGRESTLFREHRRLAQVIAGAGAEQPATPPAASSACRRYDFRSTASGGVATPILSARRSAGRRHRRRRPPATCAALSRPVSRRSAARRCRSRPAPAAKAIPCSTPSASCREAGATAFSRDQGPTTRRAFVAFNFSGNRGCSLL